MSDRTLSFGKHSFTLTHPDRVLFADPGLTKADLVDYYRAVFQVAKRHLRDRPLSLRRFPEGIDGQGFFQKDTPDYFPGWVTSAELPKEGGTVRHVVADKEATLAYLAQQGTIELHAALARLDAIDRPDRMIFDLDPSDEDFEKVRRCAFRLREILESVDLPSWVQTTGSRGLHLVVPLDRSAPFDEVREVAHALAAGLAEHHPDEATVEIRKKKRGDRVFVDFLRNAYGQTAVAPYSVRALPGAPVATPLEWSEAARREIGPRSFTVTNVLQRLQNLADPWRELPRHGRSLGKARKALRRRR